MKRILTIGAGSRHRATDGMIKLAAIKILDHAFYENVQHHADLGDFHLNNEKDFFPHLDIDFIVQTGSPFIWDAMHFSKKWQNLKLAMKTHPNAEVIFLGIGSCFYSHIKTIPIADEVLKVFEKSIVIVRDHLAHNLLAAYGINHAYLPCPAFIHKHEQADYLTPAAIWYDPSTGISAGDWQDPSKLSEFKENYIDFIEKEKPTHLYYITDEEEVGASELKKKYPRLILRKLTGAHDTIDICRRHNKLLTGRVHIAIPAHASGADVTLLPIDSRAHSFYDFQHSIITDLEEKYRGEIWKQLKHT